MLIVYVCVFFSIYLCMYVKPTHLYFSVIKPRKITKAENGNQIVLMPPIISIVLYLSEFYHLSAIL